ncbi:hypothetical protein GCM10027046_34560 [Uliginosibacterium flavum]
MISSLTAIKNRLQALNVGALGYLQKSFSNHRLVDALEDLLADRCLKSLPQSACADRRPVEARW